MLLAFVIFFFWSCYSQILQKSIVVDPNGIATSSFDSKVQSIDQAFNLAKAENPSTKISIFLAPRIDGDFFNLDEQHVISNHWIELGAYDGKTYSRLEFSSSASSITIYNSNLTITNCEINAKNVTAGFLIRVLSATLALRNCRTTILIGFGKFSFLVLEGFSDVRISSFSCTNTRVAQLRSFIILQEKNLLQVSSGQLVYSPDKPGYLMFYSCLFGSMNVPDLEYFIATTINGYLVNISQSFFIEITAKPAGIFLLLTAGGFIHFKNVSIEKNAWFSFISCLPKGELNSIVNMTNVTFRNNVMSLTLLTPSELKGSSSFSLLLFCLIFLENRASFGPLVELGNLFLSSNLIYLNISQSYFGANKMNKFFLCSSGRVSIRDSWFIDNQMGSFTVTSFSEVNIINVTFSKAYITDHVFHLEFPSNISIDTSIFTEGECQGKLISAFTQAKINLANAKFKGWIFWGSPVLVVDSDIKLKDCLIDFANLTTPFLMIFIDSNVNLGTSVFLLENGKILQLTKSIGLFIDVSFNIGKSDLKENDSHLYLYQLSSLKLQRITFNIYYYKPKPIPNLLQIDSSNLTIIEGNHLFENFKSLIKLRFSTLNIKTCNLTFQSISEFVSSFGSLINASYLRLILVEPKNSSKNYSCMWRIQEKSKIYLTNLKFSNFSTNVVAEALFDITGLSYVSVNQSQMFDVSWRGPLMRVLNSVLNFEDNLIRITSLNGGLLSHNCFKELSQFCQVTILQVILSTLDLKKTFALCLTDYGSFKIDEYSKSFLSIIFLTQFPEVSIAIHDVVKYNSSEQSPGKFTLKSITPGETQFGLKITLNFTAQKFSESGLNTPSLSVEMLPLTSEYSGLIDNDFSLNYVSKNASSIFLHINDVEAGVIEIVNISIAGQIKGQYLLRVRSSLVVCEKAVLGDSNGFCQDGHFTFAIPVKLGSCHTGQIFDKNTLTCLDCPFGTYLNAFSEDITACQRCLNFAECLGGNMVSIKPGYWRSSINSTKVYKCRNDKNSCKGGYLSECESDYYGVLCDNCVEKPRGSAKNYFGMCQECNHVALDLFLLFIIALGIMGVVVLLGRMFVRESKEKYKEVSLLKIVIIHYQIISIIPNTNFNMETTPNTFMGSLARNWYSFDCIFSKIFRFSSILSSRVIGLMLSFIIVLLMIKIVHFVKKRKHVEVEKQKILKYEYLTYNLVFFYLSQPIAIDLFMLGFSCTKIDEDFYYRYSMNSMCWNKEHWILIFLIYLPNLIFWIIVLPRKFFTYRLSLKKDLPDEKVFVIASAGLSKKYRFKGDLLVLTRKFSISLIGISANENSATIPFTILLVMSILFFVEIMLKPYKLKIANNLNIFSMGALTSTFYYIAFTLTDQKDTFKNIVYTLVVFFNIVFMMSWIANFFQEKIHLAKLRLSKFGQRVSMSISRFGTLSKRGSSSPKKAKEKK